MPLVPAHVSSSSKAIALADDLPAAPDLANLQIPRAVLNLIPRRLALRHRLVPLRHEGGRLTVAIADPFETDGIDGIARLLEIPVEPMLAPADAIAAALTRLYGGNADLADEWFAGPAAAEPGDDFSADNAGGLGATEPADAAVASDDAPVIRLVEQIISDAIQRRASDIHLEPLEKRFRVRYRIDGMLHEVEGPPKRLQLAIVSRLKIMANISIAEKRVPQDGRIQAAVGSRRLDLRVSSLPTAHGESIVMRILEKEGLRCGLPELGLQPDDAATFRNLIALPDGIVLVTGPTGSGKTTTLYGCLHAINQRERKIITVEDPVEYQLDGINQVPVRPDVGMTFASALRTMLRQAPNVVMVGEIRDRETAEIAIHASLTGHMVFSTLHTNDAPGAVTRLVDLGVKPFLVSTSLRASVAQRLVRRICPACARPHVPNDRELRALHATAAQLAGATFARGEGCRECHRTGYCGRIGIFEIFAITGEIQRLIHEQVGTAQLREKARSQGMRTMRQDGVRKATSGLTTIEEVVSITADSS